MRAWATRLFAVALPMLAASAASAQIVRAGYTDPTPRYTHAILGDALEWGALELELADRSSVKITLPDSRVFEDLSPRLVDVDLDDDFEVVVIESSLRYGARLSIYDETGLVAATPYIGQSHRWLAPVGAADLDGDGYIELAYIDRPHLAKKLRIWRFKNDALTEISYVPDDPVQDIISSVGVSNHRIGWDYILGGIKECGEKPEMVVGSGDWASVLTLILSPDGSLRAKASFDGATPQVFEAALSCP